MLEALLQARAKAIVGGPGPNYAARRTITGADLLGLAFRHAYALCHHPGIAFHAAMARLKLCRHTQVVQDTLEFQLFTS